MTDITELTPEKLEEIRQRYRPTEAPKCHICGAEMTIQRMSASRITYGCDGAIYDETGCHYAEGRSLADDHYAESRITVVDVSDPDVLALVEEREELRAQVSTQEDFIREQDQLIADLKRNLYASMQRTVTVKLLKRSVGEVMHMSGFSRDYAEGWCAGNDNAIHEMRAAGIKVEGE